jgi:hypothetical protein
MVPVEVGELGATARASAPCDGVHMGDFGAVLVIVGLAVSGEFTANRAWGSPQESSDPGLTIALPSVAGYEVSFLLGELAILNHLCISFLGGIGMLGVSQLAHLPEEKPLHLVCESARLN